MLFQAKKNSVNLDTERLSLPTCEPNSSTLSYQPWMNEIRPLQPSAGVLSVVGRKYTHAHTHSEISLRKAACYLQPFKHVLFFIAIVFDTTLCVKEPLILASPLFFHSPVSFTLSRSSFIPVPFSFSSFSCLFFSHPFHFFQHVGLVCIALLFWVSIEGKVCVKRDDFTSDSTGAIIVAGRGREREQYL